MNTNDFPPKVSPIIGGTYRLNTPNKELFNSPRKFVGKYIGHIDSITPEYRRLQNPEGHQFIHISPTGALETYVVRSNDSQLSQLWLCDGEDEPAYSLGISVERVEFTRRPQETAFLISRFNPVNSHPMEVAT